MSAREPCRTPPGFTAALDLDTYPLRNLIRPRCAERAKPGRGKPVLIMHIGFLACSHAISLERSRFSENRHVIFLALVALKLLVSLISRLVACSPRIVVDTHTHTQTHRTTTVTLAAHARRGLMNECPGFLEQATEWGTTQVSPHCLTMHQSLGIPGSTLHCWPQRFSAKYTLYM